MFLRLWLPVVLYAGGIFVVSSLSQPPSVPGGLSDKTSHGLAYSGLAVLTTRALARATWAGVTVPAAAGGAALAAAYGLTDEVHQYFVPGRMFDWLDVAADAFGAVTGAAMVLVIAGWRRT